MICTRLCPGHLNMHVWDSLRRSEEIAKNLELHLSMWLFLLLLLLLLSLIHCQLFITTISFPRYSIMHYPSEYSFGHSLTTEMFHSLIITVLSLSWFYSKTTYDRQTYAVSSCFGSTMITQNELGKTLTNIQRCVLTNTHTCAHTHTDTYTHTNTQSTLKWGTYVSETVSVSFSMAALLLVSSASFLLVSVNSWNKTIWSWALSSLAQNTLHTSLTLAHTAH